MEITLTFTFWETMINTWIVMAIIVGVSAWITRDLRADLSISKKQHALEVIVEAIEGQIGEVTGGHGGRYVPFVGTLFLFIAVSNILSIFPPISGFFPQAMAVYQQPTSAIETTLALAVCVFFAVPIFSIRYNGVRHWLKTYIEPTPFMLPFNVIGDMSNTLALAVRLFGNMMSGAVIGAILLSIVPFFFPVVMQLFGMVTGLIQAYIFGVLAMVYIASAAQVEDQRRQIGGEVVVSGDRQ